MADHSGHAPMDSAATLRELEAMIIGVGGENPSALLHTVHHQRQSAHSVARVTATKAASAKDCLAVDANQQVNFTRRSQVRSLTATPSMMKGASMAGKDRPEKRYIGKGFQPPPAESPGPIYQPPAGFAEEATMAGSGFSFSRANRLHTHSSGAQTPGPNSYPLPPTIGHQAISTTPSPSTAVFTKAPRFNEKIFISAAHSKNMHAIDAPSPAAYFTNNQIPVPGPRAPSALLLSSKESDKKTFISKEHVVDAMGKATVLVDYPPASALQVAAPRGPAFSFGTGARGTGPAVVPKVTTVDDEDDLSTSAASPVHLARGTRRKTKKRTVVRPPQEPTPGPGQYGDILVPDVTLASAPTAVFSTAPRHDKRFFSKELAEPDVDPDVPAFYAPKYDYVDPHRAAATIAGSRTEGLKSKRFTDKIFIGKAFNGGLGAASPGPQYSIPDPEKGVAFTIAHKEKHFPKTVFPGPSRPRWISRESAKDNLGAYSPGPKYDTTTDISKQGLAFSFGSAPRSAKPATHNNSANEAKAAPVVEAPVPVSPTRGVKISPPPMNQRRVSPHDETMQARAAAAPLIVPKHTVVENQTPAFSFPAAERFAKGHSVVHSASPGPVYTPQHHLVEPRVPGGGFGGLP